MLIGAAALVCVLVDRYHRDGWVGVGLQVVLLWATVTILSWLCD